MTKKKTGNQWKISPSQRYKNAIFLPPRNTAMEPLSYYYFIGPAVAAVLLLVINAVTILCSPSVKQLVVAGKVKRGELQRMPVMRYMKAEGKEEECSVCLSVFVDGQQVRQLPHCRHSFHVLCIDKWLASHCTCPVCRADVLRSGKHIAGAICVV